MSDFTYKRLDGKELSADDIKQIIKERNVRFIKLQFVDINGQVKNISIPAQHIDKILANEIMLDGSSIKGFRSIETSDMFFYPDKNTFEILPWRDMEGYESARIICDIYNADGTPFEGDIRSLLEEVVEKASKKGYSINVGTECEFYLFQLDEKGNVTNIPHDNAGYCDLVPLDKGENIRLGFKNAVISRIRSRIPAIKYCASSLKSENRFLRSFSIEIFI